MSALRECPLCGSSSIDVHLGSTRCRLCGARGPVCNTDAEAIAAWNRREPDWEQKWGELVETVCRRTDQAEKELK